MVTLNDLEHHNGSKLWYQFPGVCLEVCLLVVELTQIHTLSIAAYLVSRHWSCSHEAAATADEHKTVNYGGKNLGFGDRRCFAKNLVFSVGFGYRNDTIGFSLFCLFCVICIA